MPCTCNSICDNDCSSNQLCTGHVPACSNSYSFTSRNAGDIIRASDLLDLHSAIDGERTNAGRRFNADDPDYCSTHCTTNVACTNNDFAPFGWQAGVAVDAVVYAAHFQDVKDANNEVVTDSGYGVAIGSTIAVDGIIYAATLTEMQTRINQTRNVCICDSHCNCDPSDCGCNGECPSDDYYSYYYA